MRLERRYVEEVAAARLPTGPGDATPVTDDDIEGLPEGVQRYLRFMGVVGRPRDWSFRARFFGRFWLRPGLGWMPAEAWQYNSGLIVARICVMRLRLPRVVPMIAARHVRRSRPGPGAGSVSGTASVSSVLSLVRRSVLRIAGRSDGPAPHGPAAPPRWRRSSSRRFEESVPSVGRDVPHREERNPMVDPVLPTHLVEARHTPLFDFGSLPAALAKAHRTTVWAELRVQSGSVRYVDLEGDAPRDVRLEPGDSAVIVPGVEHHVEPSTDATFFVQFYREPGADLIPGSVPTPGDSRLLQGPWEHRGRDLDTREEIFEMVTRQYVDVVQDELLEPYFNFGPDFIDWKGHIATVTDYWCHVVLYAPDYEIDTIENHRPLHQRDPFTPELFDRWLQIFLDTVDGGWAGPHATTAKQRAAGMARAMASRFLGKGVWRPADRR